MKKRGIKLLAGLMTAGMLMATGAVGVQSIGGITAAETVETVEYKVERNEAGLIYGQMAGQSTKYKSFDEKIKSLPSGYGYTTLWLRGFDQKALAVAVKGSIESDHTATHVQIYIMRNSKVYCVGEIGKLHQSLRIRNGVLYGVLLPNAATLIDETYLINPARNGMFIKDTCITQLINHEWYHAGYINNTTDPGKVSKPFGTYDYNEIPQSETGWDMDRYEPIKFTIK